ncbi:MAG: DUF4197 domain-containing protein [Steroidobacteraceae bacterium]
MIRIHRLKLMALCLLFANAAGAADALASLSAAESTDGLKAALTQAAGVAISTLGKTDGFMADPEVRIPLPGKLQKASKTARKLGLGKQIDALTLAMNRAAEAAVPESREMLMQSIKQMSVKDAVGVLKGPENAATEYFRKSMSDKLGEKFLPIVRKATADVKLAEVYKDVAGKASALGLIDSSDASIDAYVTRKTLDGLFLVMAREEAAIRKNPLQQANALLRKVFGSLGK